MRHQKIRHKLSRDAAHRKALLANLCVEVIDHELVCELPGEVHEVVGRDGTGDGDGHVGRA